MTEESAEDLRESASLAHRRGDIEAAASLFRRILELHPGTPEAVDAKFYLAGVRDRRPPKSIGVPPSEVEVADKS